jgi:hypothetical protein
MYCEISDYHTKLIVLSKSECIQHNQNNLEIYSNILDGRYCTDLRVNRADIE